MSSNAEAASFQRAFVNELRARRENAGLSRAKLADALGCTRQWLDKVETLERPPSEPLAGDLDSFFPTEGTFHRLWTEMTDARRRSLIPRGVLPLIEAEPDARKIWIYEPMLITALFQTEAYARLVIEAGPRADRVDELVSIRMERQKLFEKEEPPVVILVIREAVIRDLPAAVRVEQCERLLALGGRANICVQVLPRDALVFHPAGFQILHFDSKPSTAYMEGSAGKGQSFTSPDEVRDLSVLHDLARGEALSTRESAALIRKIMEAG
ncbi:hypothetical protein GCM10022221_53410 [Actinocorallia aurea]